MIMKVTKTNKLLGDVYISGSKNAALPCICAALLTKEQVKLRNIPDIEDVNNLLAIIKDLGVRVKKEEDEVIINAKKVKTIVTNKLVSKLRGSYYLMGALLSRKRKVEIIYPGGCEIGLRPIDFHLQGFKDLGCEVIEEDIIEITKKIDKESIIQFPTISMGATINLILASCLGNIATTIINPSLEPETICVIEMLNKMGASIIIKDDKIYIKGVKKLSKVEHTIIYDRIEAGSYLFLAGAIPNSKVTIHNVNYKHLEIIIVVARKIGIKITKEDNRMIVEGPPKINKTNILIGAYPFFPTDLQQILTVVLTKSSNSKIEDPIFPNRITHLKELRKMQAYVYDYNRAIYIKKSTLKSSKVKATDLRCAFALIVAGAMANGTTYIKDIDYLFRGYTKPVEKLKSIGLNVEII